MKLSLEEALARLEIVPDYDPGGEGGPGPCVHTFRTKGGFILGAHWRLDEIREAIEEFGVEESDLGGHGLVVVDGRGPLYLETKEAPE